MSEWLAKDTIPTRDAVADQLGSGRIQLLVLSNLTNADTFYICSSSLKIPRPSQIAHRRLPSRLDHVYWRACKPIS